MKKQLLALGLVAALGLPQAQAANSDALTNDGSGDVIVVMRNFDNTETLFWDLSTGSSDLTAADFYSNPTLSFSISDATVNNWIASNSGAGALQFNIFGLSEVFAPPPGFLQPPNPNPDVGAVMTVASLNLQDNGGQTANSVNNLQQFIAGVNAITFPDNGVLIANNPAGNAFFGNNNHGSSLLGMSASGTVDGGPLSFFYVQQDPGAAPGTQTSVPPIATLLGSFEFTSGSLNYQAVPVPAAVWLLGSALFGLVGIRRRV